RLVRKYSPSGEELWTRSAATRSPGGLAVDGTSVYASGTNDSGGFVSKYTAAGDPLWTRQLAAADTDAILPAAITADSAGVYVGGAPRIEKSILVDRRLSLHPERHFCASSTAAVTRCGRDGSALTAWWQLPAWRWIRAGST